MARDADDGPTSRSFRIHGGECTVSPHEVRVRQTVLRHHHALAWLLTVGLLLAGTYSLVTGWQYTAGTEVPIGWSFMFLVAGYMLAIPPARRLSMRWQGFTGAKRIPLDAVRTVRLTTTDVRWYLKTRKTVPVCIVQYDRDGTTRRRRIQLRSRYTSEEVREASAAFEGAGLLVERDPEVQELTADE